MFDRRPAIIARCVGTGDVISAVNFARNNSVRIAVKGGGHNSAGSAVCDGGLAGTACDRPQPGLLRGRVARWQRTGDCS